MSFFRNLNSPTTTSSQPGELNSPTGASGGRFLSELPSTVSRIVSEDEEDTAPSDGDSQVTSDTMQERRRKGLSHRSLAPVAEGDGGAETESQRIANASSGINRVTSTGSIQPGLSILNLTQAGRDHAHKKSQSIEALNESMCVEGESRGIKGYDPTRWVQAAGVLEKKRDGRMREGWAKRFCVLGRDTLYYYLLPKADLQGFTPLLGVERGQIKLAHVQDVRVGQDKEHCYLTVTVSSVKKQHASGFLSSNVTQIFLRAPAEAGHLWGKAILKARDNARLLSADGGVMGLGFRGSMAMNPLSSIQQQSDSLDELSPRSLSPANNPVSVPASSDNVTNANPSLQRVLSASSTTSGGNLSRSNSSRRNLLAEGLTETETEPLEKLFPKVEHPKLSILLGALSVVAACATAPLWALPQDPRTDALVQMPVAVWLAFASLLVFHFATAKFAAIRMNALVGDSRFHVNALRENLKTERACAPTSCVGQDYQAAAAAIGGAATAPDSLSPLDPACCPVAGATFQHRSSAQGGMVWSDAQGETFSLRIGPNYKKTSAKAASAPGLYELLGMDLFRSEDGNRIRNLAGSKRITLPPLRGGIDDPAVIQKSGLPRLFIVNAQIPDAGTTDPGYSLVFYFSVKPETCLALTEDRGLPAHKLLLRYVKEHATNPDIRRRFKAIGATDNVDKIGGWAISSFIKKFNAKPAIINKVAQIFEGDDWFEVDISIFDFPSMARTALFALKERVADVNIKAGFTVQGEGDDELPEILLGGADVSNLDFRRARMLPAANDAS